MTYNPDRLGYIESKVLTVPARANAQLSPAGAGSLIRRFATTTALAGAAVALLPAPGASADSGEIYDPGVSFATETNFAQEPVDELIIEEAIEEWSDTPVIESTDMVLASSTAPMPADDENEIFGLGLPSGGSFDFLSDNKVVNAVSMGVTIAGRMANTAGHFVTKSVPAMPVIGDAIHIVQDQAVEIIPGLEPETIHHEAIFSVENTSVSSAAPVGEMLIIQADDTTTETAPTTPNDEPVDPDPVPTSITLRTGEEIQAELESRYGEESGHLGDEELDAIGAEWGAHKFVPEAATAFRELAEGFEQAFGEQLQLTDSYRTYESQVVLYAKKPDLAAKPGTSIHGWGMATDLTSNINSFGTPQYNWMAENATAFGWHNPEWAHDGIGREEPWHWEYIGGEITVIDGVGYHAQTAPSDPVPEEPDTETGGWGGGGGIFDDILDGGGSSEPVENDLPGPPPPDDPPVEEPDDPGEEPADPGEEDPDEPPVEDPEDPVEEPPTPPDDGIPDVAPPNDPEHLRDRQIYCIDFYVDRGLAPVEAAGPCGNFTLESGMNPTQRQYGGGPGMGLGQWTIGDRWDNNVEYAGERGWDPQTLDAQLEFSWHEMSNVAPWNQTLPQLQALDDNDPNSAARGAVIFQDIYERPNRLYAHTELRIQYANESLAAYYEAVRAAA